MYVDWTLRKFEREKDPTKATYKAIVANGSVIFNLLGKTRILGFRAALHKFFLSIGLICCLGH